MEDKLENWQLQYIRKRGIDIDPDKKIRVFGMVKKKNPNFRFRQMEVETIGGMKFFVDVPFKLESFK